MSMTPEQDLQMIWVSSQRPLHEQTRIPFMSFAMGCLKRSFAFSFCSLVGVEGIEASCSCAMLLDLPSWEP
eukprot:2389295-Amphidinium_carterae.1